MSSPSRVATPTPWRAPCTAQFARKQACVGRDRCQRLECCACWNRAEVRDPRPENPHGRIRDRSTVRRIASRAPRERDRTSSVPRRLRRALMERCRTDRRRARARPSGPRRTPQRTVRMLATATCRRPIALMPLRAHRRARRTSGSPRTVANAVLLRARRTARPRIRTGRSNGTSARRARLRGTLSGLRANPRTRRGALLRRPALRLTRRRAPPRRATGVIRAPFRATIPRRATKHRRIAQVSRVAMRRPAAMHRRVAMHPRVANHRRVAKLSRVMKLRRVIKLRRVTPRERPTNATRAPRALSRRSPNRAGTTSRRARGRSTTSGSSTCFCVP